MPSTADYEALARAHMIRQVRGATTIQVALARLWDRTVDPSDFDRSFRRFRELAIPLIQAGRLKGQTDADVYFRELLGMDDLRPASAVPRTLGNEAAMKASLGAAAKSDWTAYQIRQGGDAAALVATAKAAMLRSAKRQVLNSSRERLLEREKRDPNIRGWARVSDGSPCSFCAMLVSRGPVYSSTTGTFRAHDGCGCSVRLVTRNDPSGGWTESARALRALWEKNPQPDTFRQALTTQRRADGMDLAA
jgi:hypothetical protein